VSQHTTRARSADLVAASPALLLPDEPVPVRLMNTVWADRYGVHDALTTAGSLRVWLAAVHPEHAPLPVGTADLARFRALRDALRRLAALLTGDTRPTGSSATTSIAQAVADINEAVAQAPTWPRLAHRDGQLYAVTAGHASATRLCLSAIATHSIELLTGPDRVNLRACRGPGCVLYFVKDHPRREWCSATCGNRARAARYYQRHGKAHG
jgi:predicted RNA-binding Zn ribbon-like protein